MNKGILKRFASLTLTSYTLAIFSSAPAFAGTKVKKAGFGGLHTTVKAYDLAKTAYTKGGLTELKKQLPSDVFSENDIQYILDQARGAKTLPNMSVASDGKMHIRINEGKGVNEKIVLEIIDSEKNIFSMNGKAFTLSEGSVEENFNSLMEVLVVKKKSSLNLWNYLVPDAQAGGMSTTTLVLGAVALVAIIGAFYYRNKAKKAEHKLEHAEHDYKYHQGADPSVAHEGAAQ